MNKIKKFYPLSFALKGSPVKLLLTILIYIGIHVLFGAIILSPLVTIVVLLAVTIILFPIAFIFALLLDLLTALVNIYIISGATIAVLDYLQCFKDETAEKAEAPAGEAKDESAED